MSNLLTPQHSNPQDELKRIKNWVDAVLNGVTDAVYVFDKDFQIVFLNETAAKTSPGPAPLHIGKPIWDFQPEIIGTDVETRFRKVMDKRLIEIFEFPIGEKVFEYRAYPLADGGLMVWQVAKSAGQADSSGQKTRDFVLSRSQEMAQIGHWTWNLTTNEVNWSDTMFKIYGFEKGKFSHRLEDAMKITHPDDMKALTAFTENIARGASVRPIEYKIIRPDGETRFCYAVTDNTKKDDFGKVVEVTGIVQDVTDKHKADEMRAGLQLRDEFMSIASHELKTPLTSLDMALQLIRKLVIKGAPASDSQMQTLTYKAMESCHRLTELVNELLDLTRIRTGKVKLNPKRCDLKAAVETAIKQVSAEVGSPDIPVTVFANEEVQGEWDMQRLVQVTGHLLSNALKYGDGRAVEVHIQGLGPGGGAKLVVRDYGRGIPSNQHELIFERFERGDDTGDIKGLGLGLYVVRQIVEAHGGTIRVESEPGQGARFIVELPRSAPHG